MTNREKQKCEKLMREAITRCKIAECEYEIAQTRRKEHNMVEWETHQRKADRYYGEATGINQVLATLGFNHTDMGKLSELL